MEILAVVVALRALKERCQVSIYSDSQYVVKMMRDGWPQRWRAKGWRKAKGEPALNSDLWEALLRECEQHDVEFIWVRGHAGNPENECCDRLAVTASQQADLPVDEGYERAMQWQVAGEGLSDDNC